MRDKIDQFTNLFGKLMCIIDEEESEPPGFLSLISQTGKLGEELLRNIRQVPCNERRSIIESQLFIRGLADRIVKHVEERTNGN